MSTNKLTIFITGATGYIGGSVLQGLLDHPKQTTFEITALVRDPVKAKRFEEEFGVKTTVGSLQDLDKLSALVKEAHVVINAADNNDVNAMNAILSGLKARHDKTGDVPILIHTSGGGALLDDARGAHASAPIYSDLDLAPLDALPPTAFNRAVDHAVNAADAAGYARTYIVSPSLIYGAASGPLVKAGLANAHNVAVGLIVRSALQNGEVAVLGAGMSVWANVHIDDAADLYIRLFDALLNNPESVSHGRDGYFFVENGELSMSAVLTAVADALSALGRIPSRSLVACSEQEMGAYYGSPIFVKILFGNSRCKAERARRELGWAPKHPAQDFVDGLRAEVESLVQEDEASKSSGRFEQA
ncbi:NAD-P-binding protein [Trametes versicolor FP-101664 SS1]|uniref:NAD-P-binding protein n=1 Tax=Trametes versicolor (strain FP-101664) TaxID=717944 RepID=UPI0004621B8F|nr:NAD-P-binding protein [Trametes versicolor FP-101664 SS1]EIW57265.1 NAD-P-binding protein [Trametes versicolor FP-101664 SS1]